MSHSAEDCFGKRTNHNTIKDGLVGPMVSRAEYMKQYKKYKKTEERAEGYQESRQDDF